MQLNNLLQITLGTNTLTWEEYQDGPQHIADWVCVAKVKGIEYGRGRAHGRGDAKEQASYQAYVAVHRQVYGRNP